MQVPECKTTRDIIGSDPELSFLDQFSYHGRAAFLNTPGIFTTAFLPANNAVAAAIFNSTGLSTDQNSAQLALQNSLSLYATIQGVMSPENVMAAPSVNTILGMFVNEDYVLSMFKDNEGHLFVKGLTNVARVLEVLPACNGFVYKTDKLLFPSTTDILEPFTLASSSKILNLLVNGSTCSILLPDAVAALSDWQTGEWQSVWNATDMLSALRYNSYDLMDCAEDEFTPTIFQLPILSSSPPSSSFSHLISSSILLPHVAVFSHSLPPCSFLKMKLC